MWFKAETQGEKQKQGGKTKKNCQGKGISPPSPYTHPPECVKVYYWV